MALSKPLIVGVVGDTNSGKSTFLNVLIGQKVLAAKFQSETALLTYIVPSMAHQDDPAAVFNGGEPVVGAENIRKRIRERNQSIRLEHSEIESAEMEVETVCIMAPMLESLRILCADIDGPPFVKFIDMPGANELGNPHMKTCAEDAYCFSDVIILTVKASETTSEATDKLFKHLREIAPFHFSDGDRIDNMLIVVTHMDMCTEDDEEDDAGGCAAATATAEVKANLRRTLKQMECLQNIPMFADNIPIVAISSKDRGLFEWTHVEEFLQRMAQNVDDLHRGRQLRAGENFQVMLESFLLSIENLPVGVNRYPDRARQIVGSVDLSTDEGDYEGACAARRWRWWQARLAVLGLSVSLTCGAVWLYGAYGAAVIVMKPAISAIPAIPAIPPVAAVPAGWWGLGDLITIPWVGLTASAPAVAGSAGSAGAPAVAAVTSAVTTGLGYVSWLTGALGGIGAVGAGTDVVSAVVSGGIIEVTSSADVGARSTEEMIAEAEKQPPRDAAHILDGKERYMDILRYHEGQEVGKPPLYVGEFLRRKPDGEGQIFWPNGVPAFKGSLKDGFLHEGYLIDHRNRVHGRYKFIDGKPQLYGFQPAGELEGPCCICQEQNCMAITDQLAFRDCLHGSVCMKCLQDRDLQTCPLCMKTLARKPDGQVDLIHL